MRIVDLSDFDAALADAAAMITADEAVIYPTDTVYALAVNAASPRALLKAYAVKGRAEAKPVSLCVAELAQAEQYVELDERARRLAAAFLPGGLTLVCRSRGRLPPQVQAGFPGIGIRIPGHPFGPALARAIGAPITATSANTSGLPPATDRASALAAFADVAEQPALLIDGGAVAIGQASTVIDLTGPGARLIREGAIPFAQISAALR